MKYVSSAAVAFAASVGLAHATPVTFSFGGPENFFNEGLPGDGPWAGSITIDPDAATADNTSYPGSITAVSLTINGFVFDADNLCTDISCNSVSPVTLPGGQDAFIANYEGDFANPAGQTITASSVFIDIRTDADLFSTRETLFDTLVPGQTLALAGAGVASDAYFQMTVRYDQAQQGLDNSILGNSDLGSLSLTVANPSPVSLPAGLPLLLAGLGGLVWMRRRQS